MTDMEATEIWDIDVAAAERNVYGVCQRLRNLEWGSDQATREIRARLDKTHESSLKALRNLLSLKEGFPRWLLNSCCRVSGWNEDEVLQSFDIKDEDNFALPCGLLVSGSIGRLEIHDGSDLDFLVIADKSEIFKMLSRLGVTREDVETILDDVTRKLVEYEHENYAPERDKSYDLEVNSLRGRRRRSVFHCWIDQKLLLQHIHALYSSPSEDEIFRYCPRWSAILFESLGIWDPFNIITDLRNKGVEFYELDTSRSNELRDVFVNSLNNKLDRNELRRRRTRFKSYRRTAKSVALRPASDFVSFLHSLLVRRGSSRPDFEKHRTSHPPISKARMITNAIEDQSIEEQPEYGPLKNRINLLLLHYITFARWYADARGDLPNGVEVLMAINRLGISSIDLLLHQIHRLEVSLCRVDASLTLDRYFCSQMSESFFLAEYDELQ